jgi:hypothetical protein
VEKEILINIEDAEIELDRICDDLGIEPAGKNREAFLKLIQEGSLGFIGGQTVYNLEKPVRSESGEIVLDKLKFSEPDARQLRKSLNGIKVLSSQGTQTLDMGEATMKVINLGSAMTGVGIGILEKMKARDYEVMAAVTSFFG